MLNPRLLSTTPSLMSRGLPFSDLVSVIFSLVMFVSVMRAARMSSRPTYSVLGNWDTFTMYHSLGRDSRGSGLQFHFTSSTIYGTGKWIPLTRASLLSL